VQNNVSRIVVLGCTLVTVGMCWVIWSGRSIQEEPKGDTQQQHQFSEAILPASTTAGGYVTSNVCRECHAKQHESWHRSYHRTMTQVATVQNVATSLDGIELESQSGTFQFEQVQHELHVTMPDPKWVDATERRGVDVRTLNDPPLVTKRIQLMTGSHHMQTYWFATGRGTELRQVPWYYHIPEKRWIPAEDSYITPPEALHTPVVWNDNCVVCHSVRGRPRPHPEGGLLYTDVVEFGIACEACHGPGNEHVRRQRDIVNHPNAARNPLADLKITNPANLNSRQSSEVCGQCHATFSPVNGADWLINGYPFPRKLPLVASHKFVDFDDPNDAFREFTHAGFWNDGTSRIGGREYMAMVKSSCFTAGDISCLSCHSMHSSDPNDQLAEQMESNRACLQCHDSYEGQIEEHTHHGADSEGSRCYNCHMPHITYALFKGIRSHRIDSPDAKASLKAGRPNACNLCHTDQTLEWTAGHLSQWFGQDTVELAGDDAMISECVKLLLKGDAVQRAIVARSLSWEPAVSISVANWQPPLLAHLLEDPYSAVRYVAFRSLRTFAGFEDFEYDFVATVEERSEAKSRALALWIQQRSHSDAAGHMQLLIGPDGELLQSELDRLLQQRDDRALTLPE
jgi:predicted CXXCH cytochrome family protein